MSRTLAMAMLLGCLVGCGGHARGELTEITAAPSPTLDADAVEVGTPTILMWNDNRGVSGQVVVQVLNASQDWVNLRPQGKWDDDRLGFTPASTAMVRNKAGDLITGTVPGSEVVLNAYPTLLPPGETGYLVGRFDFTNETADNVVVDLDYVFGPAEPLADRAVPQFTDVEVRKLRDREIEVRGTVTRNEDSAVTFAGIAYNTRGAVVGYVDTPRVVRTDGEFGLCCLPPQVSPKGVKEVRFVGG